METLERLTEQFLRHVDDARELGSSISAWSLWQGFSSHLEASVASELQAKLERENVL